MVLFQQVDCFISVHFLNYYCRELDDLTHIFITYSRIVWLFQLTKGLICKLTPKQFIKCMFGKILLASHLVLVLVFMFEVWAAAKKIQLFIVWWDACSYTIQS